MTENGQEPLQYLNPIERLLAGWMVVRMFQTNTPRFAKWIESSGPHATARAACSRIIVMYLWPFVLLGVIVETAGLADVAYVLFALAGVCALWAVVCFISAIGPQRAYRRTHDIR